MPDDQDSLKKFSVLFSLSKKYLKINHISTSSTVLYVEMFYQKKQSIKILAYY